MQLFERTLGQWLEHWAEETPDKEEDKQTAQNPKLKFPRT